MLSAFLVGHVRLLVATLCLVYVAMTLTRMYCRATRAGHAERLVVFLLSLALLATSSAALLGALSWLNGTSLLMVAIVLAAVARWALPNEKDRALRVSQPPWPIWLAIGWLGIDTALWLATPPMSWDAMTYHLFFAARWLADGSLGHIPTPFSDNAAAFAPQNIALLHAWLLGLLNGDAPANILGVFALIGLAAALYLIALQVGCRRRAAWLTAATLPFVPTLRFETFRAQADVPMLAAWAGMLALMMIFTRSPHSARLVVVGLAAGFALGTKTIAVPLVAAPLAGLILFSIVRRAWRGSAWLLVGTVVAGGWWWLANAWMTGNPLFPLDVRIGPLRLAGAYDVDAIRAGSFHIPSYSEAIRHTIAQLGLPTVLLMLAGIVALAIRGVRGGRGGRRAALCALFTVGWLLYFIAAVPHNNQIRFVLPAMIIALPGWALILDGLARRRLATLTWCLTILVVVSMANGLRPWWWLLSVHRDAGTDLAATLVGCIVVVAFLALAIRRRSQRFVVAAVLFAVIVTMQAQLTANQARSTTLERSAHGLWAPAQSFVRTLDEPQTIAYAGANVPYILVGDQLQHRVLYVNTRGEIDDGFHDFWRRHGRTFEYHKPAIYRAVDDNPNAWRRRLEELEVDLIVVFAMTRAERRTIAATDDGFPLEREWMNRRPDFFSRLSRTPGVEIWQRRLEDR
ncbi:MAG: glycosyltransferase family 39 protein [Acidobacteriota bacterium]